MWPTPKATFKNTGVVLVTILVVALFVFLLDTVFMNLLGLVMERGRVTEVSQESGGSRWLKKQMVCGAHLLRV